MITLIRSYLFQSRTYAPTGNRDLERDFLSQDLLSPGIGYRAPYSVA